MGGLDPNLDDRSYEVHSIVQSVFMQIEMAQFPGLGDICYDFGAFSDGAERE